MFPKPPLVHEKNLISTLQRIAKNQFKLRKFFSVRLFCIFREPAFLGRISDLAQIKEVVVATACEPSGVAVFAESQPIARRNGLRRRLTEPWLQERITDDQL